MQERNFGSHKACCSGQRRRRRKAHAFTVDFHGPSLGSFALARTERAFSSSGGIAPCAQASRQRNSILPAGGCWRTNRSRLWMKRWPLRLPERHARLASGRRPGVTARGFCPLGVPSAKTKAEQRLRRRRIGLSNATACRPLFITAPLPGRRRAPQSRTAPLVHGGRQKMYPDRSAWCIRRRSRPLDTCRARRRVHGPSMPR